MSSPTETSRATRLMSLAGGLALAAATLVLLPERPTPARAQLPGALGAMDHWSRSRAYPDRDIPPGAYYRAYEYSRDNLRGDLDGLSPAGGAPGGTSGWDPLGPRNGGGRALTLAFHPLDPNEIYVGAASGGLWRSTTGGVGAAAWERIDTGHPVLGVSSIAFEPGNPSVMYIGTGEVYNHQDAGNLEADRATRGSYGIGILKSTDGGATWSKSLDWSYDQRHGVWAVRVDPTDTDVVWAATTDGVYKSLDAGQSWTKKHAVVMAMDLILHPLDPDIALVGCGNMWSSGRGIYRTTDGGDNWSKISGGGVPSSFGGKIQFAVTPADPNLVFASIGNGFSSSQGATWLLRSTNFGASFQLRTTTDYSRYQGWFAHDVAVNPSDSSHVMCVGIDVWKSTNGGSSLTQKSNWWSGYSGDIPDGGPEGPPDYSHADHHDVLFHPTDHDVIYFANDGGVFRSTDGGETFEGVNGGMQTQQFYNGATNDPTDPNLAMGGLQDNSSVIYRGGGRWDRGVLGGDGGWCAIDPTNPNTVFATAQYLYVGRSDDGGVNFYYISPPDLGGPAAFISPLVMSPTNPSVLYGGTSYLFRSTDGGWNWSTLNGGSPLDGNAILVLAAAPQDGDVLYIATVPGGARGKVYRTLNGGASFTEITGTLPDRFPGDLAVDPTDEATVYIALSGFGSSHLFRSTDYGATWVDLDGGRLPDVPAMAVAVDPEFPDHVYVGNDLGVYVTNDGGATWAQLYRGWPEAVLVQELGVSPSDRKLRAFTHGSGVWEYPLFGRMGFRPSTPPKTYTR